MQSRCPGGSHANEASYQWHASRIEVHQEPNAKVQMTGGKMLWCMCHPASSGSPRTALSVELGPDKHWKMLACNFVSESRLTLTQVVFLIELPSLRGVEDCQNGVELGVQLFVSLADELRKINPKTQQIQRVAPANKTPHDNGRGGLTSGHDSWSWGGIARREPPRCRGPPGKSAEGRMT